MRRGDDDVTLAEKQIMADYEQWEAWQAYLFQARPTLAELREIRDECLADDMDIDVDGAGRVVGRLGQFTRAQARVFFESGGDWAAAPRVAKRVRAIGGTSFVPAGFGCFGLFVIPAVISRPGAKREP